MDQHKDIRFTEKKVDESWKEEISKVKPSQAQGPSSKTTPPSGETKKTVKSSPESQKQFINFLMGVATQALYLMGAVEGSGVEKDLDGAQEMIDILKLLQEKTEGNLTDAEKKAFEKILYDLQLSYVQASRPEPPKAPKS
jgi:CRISPR/Cas system-associated exonuclease Cas4 (RecB family)